MIDEYTGRSMSGKIARYGEKISLENGVSWLCRKEGTELVFELEGIRGRDCTVFVELNRLHPPFKVFFKKEDEFVVSGSVYLEKPDIKLRKEDDIFQFRIDLADFSEFLRDGVPLRMNVFGDDFAWVPHEKLPSRLMFGDTNWNCAGWLTE